MRKPIIIVLTASLILVLSALTSAAGLGPPRYSQQPCLKYEPRDVELIGLVKRTVFAGPPNYESVRRGDVAEPYWVLQLAQPICVTADPADVTNSKEVRVRDLPLIFDDVHDYAKYESLLRQRAAVTGTLTHAITGHHHTAVMLVVKRMKLASTPPNNKRL